VVDLPDASSMSGASRVHELDLEVGAEGDVLTFDVAGDLDLSVADRFEGEVLAALFTSDATICKMDLSGVSFIDSTCLSVILGTEKAMRERGGTLVLRHPSPTVHRLLEITALTGKITIEP
jgi:anti-anti-sigma factor